MKKLIEQFPDQIVEAIRIGKNATLPSIAQTYAQVLVSGLGGSGIGASIVADYCYQLLSIPFLVNKNYFIPKYVNENTLFIACSYSGNTEETLQAVLLAKKQKAKIVCITSGGKLQQFAEKNKLPLILIPDGMPPRACLGYSMVQLLYVLQKAKLLKTNFEKELLQGLELISTHSKQIHTEAKKIATALLHKQTAIYCTQGYEGLAIRYRQQLNENSKVLAWHNVIPEMTHNEIVGWKTKQDNLTVVLCDSPLDFEKNKRRLQYLKKVIKTYHPTLVHISMKGENYWQQAMHFIHLTDWVSVYLAQLNGNDTIEVKVIDGLKKEMEKK